MKNIILLQNSYVSFGLDASKIYQPDKYNLYLIINEFCFNLIKSKNQSSYYKKILITNEFDFDNILLLITSCINKTEEFDIITNSEETMPICGKLRKFLGIDPEDYSRFYNKHVMKMKLANTLSISIPKYRIFDPITYHAGKKRYLETLIADLCFPLFAKPIQLYSSINLRKINNYDELSQWAESITNEDYYELDEFIEGKMYHCDSYIKNGKILFTFISQNSRPCYDFTVGKIKGTIVLPPDHIDTVRLSEVTENVLNELGPPKAGVTHLEIIKSNNNEIYFIEIAHRSPGCLIPKMYLIHANVDTITSHFLLQIDNDYHPLPQRDLFAAWSCYPKIPGKISALNMPPDYLESSYEIEWKMNVGDIIKTYSQFGRDYTGTIFMKNKNFQKLYEEFEIINNINLCEIESISA